MSSRRVTRTLLLFISFLPVPAFAGFSFSDSFTGGPSPLWSNLRGNWYGHDGVYDAQNPSNAPPTQTSIPYSLGNLSLDVDVNAISDGGVWLHTDAGSHNGVLLVTGGNGWGSGDRSSIAGRALYFHEVHNDSYTGKIGEVFPGFNPGDNVHLHITVVGDTYSVFLNGSTTPADTLVTPDFPFGRVGLYDYSSIQTFDNFAVASPTIPGDANQDGRINGDDYALTDRGFAKGLSGFQNGDFNADGVVNASDEAILDASLLRQSLPTAPVPEPGALLVFGALPLLVRGRSLARRGVRFAASR